MLVAKGVFVELGEDGEFEDLGLRVWGEWEFWIERESENDKWEKWKPNKRDDEKNRGKLWGWKFKSL